MASPPEPEYTQFTRIRNNQPNLANPRIQSTAELYSKLDDLLAELFARCSKVSDDRRVSCYRVTAR